MISGIAWGCRAAFPKPQSGRGRGGAGGRFGLAGLLASRSPLALRQGRLVALELGGTGGHDDAVGHQEHLVVRIVAAALEGTAAGDVARRNLGLLGREGCRGAPVGRRGPDRCQRLDTVLEECAPRRQPRGRAWALTKPEKVGSTKPENFSPKACLTKHRLPPQPISHLRTRAHQLQEQSRQLRSAEGSPRRGVVRKRLSRDHAGKDDFRPRGR